MTVENRRSFRLPSNTRFILSNGKAVYTGKATNISLGGAFIHMLNFEGIRNGDKLKCEFMLQENAAIMSANVFVKRVAFGTDNPSDLSGLGLAFTEFFGDTRRELTEFMLDQKRIYELMGTLLTNTEPDLRSIRPLLAKLPVSRLYDLRDLKVFIEGTLRAIQMVESGHGDSPSVT